MKLFANNTLNTLFTVKKGSDTSDLIEVEISDAIDFLINKGCVWAWQVLLDKELCLTLEDAECDDQRISRVVEVRHQDALSESCQEVLPISEKVKSIAEKALELDYYSVIDALELCDSVEVDQDWESDETIYTLRDESRLVDKAGYLFAE